MDKAYHESYDRIGKQQALPYRTRIFGFLIFCSILLFVLLCYIYTTDYHTMTSVTEANDFFNDRVRFKKTSRRLPQCLIIGAKKAGTRALLEMLNLHPHIQKASTELHFFDREENYSKGLEWYRKRMPFSFPGQVTIEKSPSYFVTPLVPERIHAMNSSIRILLIVRDPIDRLASDYTQLIANKKARGKKYDITFSEIVLNMMGEVKTEQRSVRTSCYVKYLRHWYDVFNSSQIHVVNGDVLISKPVEELHKIESFLNLDHKISQNNFYFNSTKGFYCLKQNSTFRKCLSPSKGRQHPEIPATVLNTLREYYYPYNERFFELIGEDYGWNNFNDAD